MKNIDESIREYMNSKEIDIPKMFHFFGIHIFIWKKSNGFMIRPLILSPYGLDGEIPTVYIYLGRVDISFDSKFLYKIVYKRMYGYSPLGLD